MAESDLFTEGTKAEKVENDAAASIGTAKPAGDNDPELWDDFEERSRQGARRLNLKGARVCYYRSGGADSDITNRCDHSDQHNEHWKKALEPDDRLETGSIVDFISATNEFQVKWDCGVTKLYPESEWGVLKTYDLAPTGNSKLNVIWCDACLLPAMGYAFRLASGEDDDDGGHPTTADKFYDLCYLCYNAGRDSQFLDQQFRCNLPSDDIAEKSRPLLTPRADEKCYKQVGLITRSQVQGDNIQGTVVRTVHEGGHTNMRKAQHWRSYAEIDPKVSNGNGSGIKKHLECLPLMDLSVTIPETHEESEIYIDHFPSVEESILLEEKLECETFTEADYTADCICFKRYKGPEGNKHCWSLTITGTELTHIKDIKIWKDCKGQLRVCNLHMNNLVDLPHGLSTSAESLHLLCIQSNRFLEIPDDVFEFLDLYYLNMHENFISCVPKSIQKLSALTHLYIGKNNLRFLPDVFNKLQCLIKLTLEGNKLIRLPPSLSSLRKLHTVDLSHNKFTEIPPVLLQLKASLRSLRMEYNSIQHVGSVSEPESTRDFLKELSYLNLSGNPLQHSQLLTVAPNKMLDELLKPGVLEQLNSAPLRKSQRILLVGSCGAGKTSVAEALGLKKYVTPTSSQEHDHTIGINRYTVPIQVEQSQGDHRTIELILWDFAGEESNVPMHNIFLSNVTIVFIVVNLESYNCNTEDYNKHVGNWIRPIMMRSTRPTVWLVPTHTDKCDNEQTDTKVLHLKRKIKKECKRLKEDTEAKLSNYREAIEQESGEKRNALEVKLKSMEKVSEADVPNFIKDNLRIKAVTNTYGLKGIDDLKDAVSKLLQERRFHELSELKNEWVVTANFLQKKAEDKIAKSEPPLISSEMALEVIERDISGDSDKFLSYLEHKGDILKLGINGEKIILDVKWLIQILQEVFRHDFDERVKSIKFFTKRELEAFLTKKNESGVIDYKLLQALWREHGVSKNISDIMKLLMDFGLACKVNEGYLLPWFLPKSSSPEDKKKLLDCTKATITVEYEFHFSMPMSFFETFAAYCSTRDCFENFRAIHKAFSVDYGEVSLAALCEPHENGRHVTIRLCACRNTKTMEQAWKGFMNLVKQIEVALSGQSCHNSPTRWIVCPGCIETKQPEPRRYGFEYDHAHSAKKTFYYKEGLNLVCKTCQQTHPPETFVAAEEDKVDSSATPAPAPHQPRDDAQGESMVVHGGVVIYAK